MFGHRGFQPVIQAIIKLAEKAAKEPWDFQPPDKSKYVDKVKALVGGRPAQGVCHAREAEAPRAGRGGQRQGQEGAAGRRRRRRRAGAARLRVQGPRAGGRARRHHPLGQAHRRPRSEDRAADPLRGARAAARARLGALHPRRDAGPGRRHARHRRGRAVHRRARGHAQGALPAALQLPALLGRRDRPHGLARPARDRPRQARLARGASADAEPGGVSLHGAHRLRDHRIQRLLVDGDRVRRLAGADGRGRAARSARWPASPWA